MYRNQFVIVICTALLSSFSFAEPEHLVPYQGAPAEIKLTAEQTKTLAKGKPVYPRLVENKDTSGSAQAVFTVEAPPKVVWQVISDFEKYPDRVDGVKEIEYYKPKEGDLIYVKFTVGKWFTPAYRYHIVHKFRITKNNYGTWFLDKKEKNDLTGCRGFWRVKQSKTNPNQSIVEYSVDLKTEGFVLNIIRPILVKNGVHNATSWVSKHAKLAYQKQVELAKLKKK